MELRQIIITISIIIIITNVTGGFIINSNKGGKYRTKLFDTNNTSEQAQQWNLFLQQLNSLKNLTFTAGSSDKSTTPPSRRTIDAAASSPDTSQKESFERKSLSALIDVESLLNAGSLSEYSFNPVSNITVGDILEIPKWDNSSSAAPDNDQLMATVTSTTKNNLIPDIKIDFAGIASNLINLVTFDNVLNNNTTKVAGYNTANMERFENLISQQQQQQSTATNIDESRQKEVIDNVFNVFTKNLEDFLWETSNKLSPSLITDLFSSAAGQIFALSSNKNQLDTTFVNLANKLLKDGYASTTAYKVVKLDKKSSVLKLATEMVEMAAFIYDDPIDGPHSINHNIVANGTVEDIAYIVTDSVLDKSSTTSSTLKRTITIRGYDASDEDVDRERLLLKTVEVTPVPLFGNIYVHSGLYSIARELYQVLRPFILGAAPSSRIVLNGHSIGGSLSVLLMYLARLDFGSRFVSDRFRVFTFGSPSVTFIQNDDHVPLSPSSPASTGMSEECDILQYMGLPTHIVRSYVQPWDPVVRLFTEIDPCYPLVEDMGPDGLTPFSNGPPRTLRTVIRSLADSIKFYPKFVSSYKGTGYAKYRSVGLQYVLLPEPGRYLTDRLVSVNLGVPPLDSIIEIPSYKLWNVLEDLFPMDEFDVSLLTVAVRSFIHHFHPAYTFPLVSTINNSNDLDQEPLSEYFDKKELKKKKQQSISSQNKGESSILNNIEKIGE